MTDRTRRWKLAVQAVDVDKEFGGDRYVSFIRNVSPRAGIVILPRDFPPGAGARWLTAIAPAADGLRGSQAMSPLLNRAPLIDNPVKLRSVSPRGTNLPAPIPNNTTSLVSDETQRRYRAAVHIGLQRMYCPGAPKAAQRPGRLPLASGRQPLGGVSQSYITLHGYARDERYVAEWLFHLLYSLKKRGAEPHARLLQNSRIPPYLPATKTPPSPC